MQRMAGSVREVPKGSGRWQLTVTVPRAICLPPLERQEDGRPGNRRATSMIGPRHLANAIAREADGLLALAGNSNPPILVRAWDILRDANDLVIARQPGASPRPAAPTVADYVESWLRTVSGSTRDQFRRVYNCRIGPTFGPFPLNQIPKRLIREWIHGMEDDGLSPETVGTYFRTLAAMLSQAVRDEEIDRHPCPSIRTIMPSRSRGNVDKPALTTEQLAAAIKANRHVTLNKSHRLAIEIMAATGLRIGEVVALRWTDLRDGKPSVTSGRASKADVTFRDKAQFPERENRAVQESGAFSGSEQVLLIQRQRARHRITEPKTARSRRSVEIAPSMVAALRAYRVELQEAALAQGRRASAWMLPRPDGKPYSDQAVRKAWEIVAREAKLLPEGVTMRQAGMGPHVLRHTWITHRLGEGVPVADVSKAAGHANPGVTMRHYAHALPRESGRLRVDLDALTGGE